MNDLIEELENNKDYAGPEWIVELLIDDLLLFEENIPYDVKQLRIVKNSYLSWEIVNMYLRRIEQFKKGREGTIVADRQLNDFDLNREEYLFEESRFKEIIKVCVPEFTFIGESEFVISYSLFYRSLTDAQRVIVNIYMNRTPSDKSVKIPERLQTADFLNNVELIFEKNSEGSYSLTSAGSREMMKINSARFALTNLEHDMDEAIEMIQSNKIGSPTGIKEASVAFMKKERKR